MEFPTATEFDGGTQEFLLKLRDSKLTNETIVDEFYEKVLQMYDYVGNYLILLLYASYDVPGKTSDKIMMEDASTFYKIHIDNKTMLCYIIIIKQNNVTLKG